MDDRTFAKLIEDPKRIDAAALEQLIKVVEKYPYFSLAQLVYLKGLKRIGDTRLSTLLSHVATHAPSGEWLYLYLSDYEQAIQPVDNNFDEQFETSNSIEEEVQPEICSANLPSVQVAVEQPEVEQCSAEHETLTEEEPIAIVEDAVPTEELPVIQEVIQPEEEAVELAEVVAEIQLAVEPEVEASSDEESAEELMELIDDELTSDCEDPIFEILDQKLYTLDDNEKLIEHQYSLIDQFLSSNTRIVPKADLPPVIEDISMKSLEDDGAIVTETFAKICASQGLIDKAEDIYRKLCLKFPEKKAYFVAELEKLKESK